MTTFTTQDRQDAQRTPLTEEEITKIYNKVYDEQHQNQVLALARAIERAHGIGND